MKKIKTKRFISTLNDNKIKSFLTFKGKDPNLNYENKIIY